MFRETQITEAIVSRYFEKFRSSLHVDVAVAGAGPSGLTAAALLAESGFSVSLYEKKLSPGGGIWGGGMLFPEIVVGSEALHLLEKFGIRYHEFSEDTYTADSVQTAAALIYRATLAGVRFFNAVSVEDVLLHQGRVNGFVINWTPVEMAGLHVDPLAVSSRVSLDATGHPLEIVNILKRKNNIVLNTANGEIIGEGSMEADSAERAVVENTGEIFPGLFVSGMAASAAKGSPRMGPVFGGMLCSGEKVAHQIKKALVSL